MAELREELEEKKDRVKKRLVETDSDETNLYKEKRKVLLEGCIKFPILSSLLARISSGEEY